MVTTFAGDLSRMIHVVRVQFGRKRSLFVIVVQGEAVHNAWQSTINKTNNDAQKETNCGQQRASVIGL